MKKYKFIAIALCLCLILSALPYGVLASGDEIRISTASELRNLAEKCRLDSWSQGKTVILESDIDLGGVEFSPIPSFGGTFDGRGHSIIGLYVKGDGSSVGGLFRFIQKDGLVKDLNVEGRIAPNANAESFGGIAGENSGIIMQCSFSGVVDGSVEIGGIVGLNSSGGEISDCRSLAMVSGEHYTGGIAGRNLGSIIRCTNLGAVNTTNPEMESEALNIDWAELNSTENVSAHTDTGGIAGLSLGTLEHCVNRGNVGYPHVGYNVGGIAGRQSGTISDCRNFGLVNGRKDVGGVVGQMVPAIEMHFSGSALSELENEMAVLKEMLDKLINDVQGSSNEISGILSTAGSYLDSAGQSAGIIGDAIIGFVDGNLDVINGYLEMIPRYLERIEPIMAKLENGVAHISAAMGAIEKFLDDPENAEKYKESFEKLQSALEKTTEALDDISEAMELIESAMAELSAYLENAPESGSSLGYEEFAAMLRSVSSKLSKAGGLLGDGFDKISDAFENDILPVLEEIAKITSEGELPETLETVRKEFGYALDSLESAFGDVESFIRDLSREEGGVFEGLGDDFMAEADRMQAALMGLSGQMDKLNTAVNGSVNIMSEDLRLINDQFFKVMNAFLDMLGNGGEETEIYEDVSEEELFTKMDGKVQNCENRGAVAGDVNSGGIAGTMGIEYDLDPEEDISVSGSTGGTFRYFTNDVLLQSVNYESVRGKKNCVGGAVGYMDLGVVYGCENYGEITSLSGDYVGGIAGQSLASIRNCWNLCVLNGRDYVGGIAGSVNDISGCRCIVKLSATGGWKGAIAGEVMGEAKENYFVGEKQGGIDGVSYAGKAEPMEYNEFVKGEVPGEFLDFKLTFATDSIVVKSINFTYGKSIDLGEIPPVPERVGHVGAWEKYDFTNLTFSDTIYAVYTPYDTVVATEQQDGKKAIVLLEGAFLPGSVPLLEEYSADIEGAVAAWTVTAVGSTEYDYKIRYLAPSDSEELKMYVLSEGQWFPVTSERDGSYIIFGGAGETTTFAAVEPEKEFPVVPLILTASGGILLVVLVLIIRARVGKKHTKTK